MENRYVIIHGHFYQPPREDPWLDQIPLQPSAKPYHDWNERINYECYQANASSRILSSNGQIEKIINNFEYLSFNFGPTLINWLRENDYETYEKIIDADKVSIERNSGHGNAIAQVYNHVIMPLSNDRDKITQIEWGLKDFQHHFNRDSEGIWLSETAINERTVDILIDFGIKYVILSPTQAEKVRKNGSEKWENVSHSNIDTSRPYLVRGKNGKLACFFYNMPLSIGVSFEGLLNSSDKFISSIKSRFPSQTKEPYLISIATDGETYGHHQAFGDMCLSATFDRNNSEYHFKITNYARYLEICSPKDEVVLKSGNENLGTSWSCVHGVGRWMSDCGCSTGGQSGWNQKWRAPLRAAFDYLRDELAKLFENEGSELLEDVWKARNDYIECLLEPTIEKKLAFLNSHAAKELNDDDKTLAIKLLEAQKYSMYMYTSCGWFFAELSGIETVQCIKYAVRALQLFAEFNNNNIEEEFEKQLLKAKSNITHYQDGKWIYEHIIRTDVYDDKKIVNQFVLLKIFKILKSNEIFYYSISDFNFETKEKGDFTVFFGSLSLLDKSTYSKNKYLFYIVKVNHVHIKSYIKKFNDPKLKEYLDCLLEENNCKVLCRKFDEWFTDYFTLKDVTLENREKILWSIFEKIFIDLSESTENKFDDCVNLVNIYSKLNVHLPEIARSLLEAKLNKKISLETIKLQEKDISEIDFSSMEQIFLASKTLNINLELDFLGNTLGKVLCHNLEILKNDINSTNILKIISLIDFANKINLEFRRRQAENIIYSILHNQITPMIKQYVSSPKKENLKLINNILSISEKLNINVKEFKDTLENRS